MNPSPSGVNAIPVNAIHRPGREPGREPVTHHASTEPAT
jgi:hypothetical protein